jgi:hypothetical protein
MARETSRIEQVVAHEHVLSLCAVQITEDNLMLFNCFRRFFGCASMLVAGAVLTYGGTAHATAPCTIAFNDHYGLSRIDRQSQAYGFMEPVSPGPGVHTWYYNACSSTGEYFYMAEDSATQYGHFHIPPSDPTINCFTSNSTYSFVYGRTVNGQCVAVDPLYMDRTVINHQPDERMTISDISSSAHWRPTGISVLAGSATVQLTILEANGQYWVSGNLTANHNWTIGWNSGPGTGAVAAWIGEAPGQSSEFNIDNVVINYTTD